MRRFRERVKSFYVSTASEGGSSLVEFALVAPTFLLLIFAVIDFGRGLFDYDLVANSARLGTRFAIVRGAVCTTVTPCPATKSDIITYVRNSTTGISKTDLTVDATWQNTTVCTAATSAYGTVGYPLANGPGCSVTVTVSYPFKFAALPFFSVYTMMSSSTMTISR